LRSEARFRGEGSQTKNTEARCNRAGDLVEGFPPTGSPEVIRPVFEAKDRKQKIPKPDAIGQGDLVEGFPPTGSPEVIRPVFEAKDRKQKIPKPDAIGRGGFTMSMTVIHSLSATCSGKWFFFLTLYRTQVK
jgi:hypothetical protein